jgi:hypothetical protein
MKQLLIVVLCFLALNARSQIKTTETKEINVYGRDGKFVTGKVIVNRAKTTKLFLLKSIQKKDTSNNYITTFYLGNKETTAVAGVLILMKFSKPVIGVMPSFSAAFNNVNALSDDHLTYIFKANPLNRDPGSAVVISFAIKSKDKITTEISGLDGVLP